MKNIFNFNSNEFETNPYFKLLRTNLPFVLNAMKGKPSMFNWSSEENSLRLQILFIGQTGVGKSTTINSLTKGDYMLKDDIVSYTKEPSRIYFEICSNPNIYLSLCDMPGIDKNVDVDEQYYKWYETESKFSDAIVYILNADKRDYTEDIEEFCYLRQLNPNKLLIAINGIDKIEPNDKHYYNEDSVFDYSRDIYVHYLSKGQLRTLQRKIEDVSSIFNIETNRIVPISAKDHKGLEALGREISNVLINNVYHKHISKKWRNEWFYKNKFSTKKNKYQPKVRRNFDDNR